MKKILTKLSYISVSGILTLILVSICLLLGCGTKEFPHGGGNSGFVNPPPPPPVNSFFCVEGGFKRPLEVGSAVKSGQKCHYAYRQGSVKLEFTWIAPEISWEINGLSSEARFVDPQYITGGLLKNSSGETAPECGRRINAGGGSGGYWGGQWHVTEPPSCSAYYECRWGENIYFTAEDNDCNGNWIITRLPLKLRE